MGVLYHAPPSSSTWSPQGTNQPQPDSGTAKPPHLVARRANASLRGKLAHRTQQNSPERPQEQGGGYFDARNEQRGREENLAEHNTKFQSSGAIIYKSGKKLGRNKSGKASPEEAFLRERGPRTEYVHGGLFLQGGCFSLNLALYYILT